MEDVEEFTWDKLEQQGLGMLGMPIDELYDLTPRSFSNKLYGYNKKEELKMQSNWEQTRMIVHACVSPHLKRKIKPTDLLPFDWDEKYKPKKEVASKEHINKVIDKYKKKQSK